MATANDYAAWIVGNQNKRGTKEFDTVAAAYQEAKRQEAQAAAPAPQEPGLIDRAIGIGEAGLSGVSGTVGYLAGLAAGGNEAVKALLYGATGTKPAPGMMPDPSGAFERTSQALTIAPKTQAGIEATQGLAEIAEGLAPIAGLQGEAAVLSRAAGQAARTAAPIATAAAQRAAQAMGRPAQAARGAASDLGAVSAAERMGIPVMTSDVSPPTTFAGKTAQQFGERIPLAGTAPLRVKQQSARVEAVRDVMREYGADDAAQVSDEVMRDLASKRSSEISKYSALKGEVFDRVESAGTVNVEKTTRAIDEQIWRLTSLKTNEASQVIAKLEDWKQAIQGQGIQNIETLRKQVGEAFTAPELTAARSTGEKALSAIYGPLRADMAEHIKTYGDRRDLAKWSVANSRLSALSGEMKNDSLAYVLRRGDHSPEVVQKLLFSTKPSDAKALYRNLTPEGRENAKVAILAKALDNAGGMDELSPEKFITSVKKLGAPIGVFFQGEERARMDGLVAALKLTRRASQANFMPNTGAQVALPVGAAVLADFLGSGGAAILTGATIGGLARVYESAAVRNLLIKLGKAKSPNEQAQLMAALTAAVSEQNAKAAK